MQVTDALDRGLELVTRCESLGRLEAIMSAIDIASSFANVAKDLQLALLPMDLADLGCDEITQKQVRIILEQLGKVQAPFPEEEQRCLIQLRKLAEDMRVAEPDLKNMSTASPESAGGQLRDLVRKNVLDGYVTTAPSCMHLLMFDCALTQVLLVSTSHHQRLEITQCN
jgi:hypothetical protein